MHQVMWPPGGEDSGTAERESLRRLCARFTGDADAAEDLAQQMLLEAWRHEQGVRDPQARRAWLFRIARNLCVTWARGRRRALAHLSRWDEEERTRPGREGWPPAGPLDL